MKINDKYPNENGPLEGDVNDYDIVEDQDLINFVIRSVARGRRQEEFIRRAFSHGGVSPALYLKNWFVSWTVSMHHLLQRLLDFLNTNFSYLDLVLIKEPGPKGAWTADRYFIRKIPFVFAG